MESVVFSCQDRTAQDHSANAAALRLPTPPLLSSLGQTSQNSTLTGVPAGNVASAGTSTKPPAAAIELSTCEACAPARDTLPSPLIWTRTKCRREPVLTNGSARIP